MSTVGLVGAGMEVVVDMHDRYDKLIYNILICRIKPGGLVTSGDQEQFLSAS